MAEGRVALVTHDALPALSDDDRRLIPALAGRGVAAVPASWSDPSVDWTSFDAVIMRSCWDYHLRLAEFLGWLAQLEATGVAVWNPAPVIRWNANKRYLRELHRRGVPGVPTRWVPRHSNDALAALLEDTGWDEVVVKPAVSAAAHGTWRTSRARADADEPRFRAATAAGELMVQPLLSEVQHDGEWSLVCVDGQFSHAVLKRPAAGDFRVQLEFGGSIVSASPPPAVTDSVLAVLAAIPGQPLYARIDGCLVHGRFLLMEVELIEPALFLAHSPQAAERLADAIAAASRYGRPLAESCRV